MRRRARGARELPPAHPGCHAPPVPDNKYRLPEDEFYASAEVPLEQQVAVHSELVPPPVDGRGDPVPWADGGSGDADGD